MKLVSNSCSYAVSGIIDIRLYEPLIDKGEIVMMYNNMRSRLVLISILLLIGIIGSVALQVSGIVEPPKKTIRPAGKGVILSVKKIKCSNGLYVDNVTALFTIKLPNGEVINKTIYLLMIPANSSSVIDHPVNCGK